jgi:excisionase family DNA binding protein
MPDERYLTVEQAAERLQAHPETIRRLLRAGRLIGSQPLGRRGGWRIAESQIVGLLMRPVGRPSGAVLPAGERTHRALAQVRAQAERARERGDDAGAARFEAIAAGLGGERA